MIDNSEIFYGTSGPRDAKIAIIGESWGPNEARRKKPFVGNTGGELDKILAECGIARPACFISNVVSERPNDNEMLWFFHTTKEARKEGLPCIRGLYPKPNVMRGVERLRKQLEIVKPEIVIGFGNYTLWALTENCFGVGDKYGRKVPTGITSWRGSQLYCSDEMGGFRLLPTYHPAAVFRTWPWRYDIVHDLKSRVPKALKGQWDPPPYRFIIRPSFEVVMSKFSEFEQLAKVAPLRLAEDLETFGGHISCIGLAWSNLDAICIPFSRGDGTAYWSEEEEVAIVNAIRKLHSNPNVQVVGQNFLYDAQYIILYWGFIPNCVADTMLLHHLCWPGLPKSLAYISSLYNNYYAFWKEEGKQRHPSFSDDQHWSYNCKDSINTFEADSHLQKLVNSLGLREQADERIEVFNLALDMMLRGCAVDRKARSNFNKELTQSIDQRCAWLGKIIPHDVFPPQPKKSPWYTSPMQQAELFYDVLGVAEVKGRGKRTTKGRTCNDEALTIIGDREPILRPIIQALQELRSLKIFRKNFVEAPLDPDHRLRCSYDPSGTKTFRWNSFVNAFGYGTNLQTIPKGTEDWD